MQRLVTGATLASLVGLTTSSAADRASAQAVQTPKITVEYLDFEGTGCPAGTIEPLPIVSNERLQRLGLKLTAYDAFVDPAQRYVTLDCEIRLTLKAPAGLRTALNTITYYGYADLDQGVTGNFQADYNWSGRPLASRSTTPKVIVGPNVAPFTFTDRANAVQWSDCATEEELTLQTRLSLTNSNPGRSGNMKIDRTEVEVQGSVILEFLAEGCTTPAR